MLPAYGCVASASYGGVTIDPLSRENQKLYDKVYAFVQTNLRSELIAITKQDLALIDSLSARMTSDDELHLYQLEDGQLERTGNALKRAFERSLIAASQSLTPGLLERAVDSSIGFPPIFRLKHVLQRCRPHQAAWHLSSTRYLYEVPVQATLAGHSPSLPSGHCWQAYSVLLRLLHMDAGLTSGQKDALILAAVGISDRRVFAGVHFPSDNLASWFGVIVEARLLRVSGEVGSALVDAIKRSETWKAMVRTGGAYTAAITALEEEFVKSGTPIN